MGQGAPGQPEGQEGAAGASGPGPERGDRPRGERRGRALRLRDHRQEAESDDLAPALPIPRHRTALSSSGWGRTTLPGMPMRPGLRKPAATEKAAGEGGSLPLRERAHVL